MLEAPPSAEAAAVVVVEEEEKGILWSDLHKLSRL